MTPSEERWDDPVPPGTFTPSDETVRSIIERANAAPVKAPRNRMVASIAALAFVVIGCAMGIRLLETAWGETVLPRNGYAAQNAAGTAQSQALPNDHNAGDVVVGEIGVNDHGTEAAPVASVASVAPLPTATPLAAQGEKTAAAQADSSERAQTELAELCARADAIVAGSFDGQGAFIAEEQLKGECPARIPLTQAASFRGWAVVFLIETEDGWVFSEEPFLFRVDNGLLSARDANGAPTSLIDSQEEEISLEVLRETIKKSL